MSGIKRKADAAQKLMRLIHSSGFCRDIAVWHDESKDVRRPPR